MFIEVDIPISHTERTDLISLKGRKFIELLKESGFFLISGQRLIKDLIHWDGAVSAAVQHDPRRRALNKLFAAAGNGVLAERRKPVMSRGVSQQFKLIFESGKPQDPDFETRQDPDPFALDQIFHTAPQFFGVFGGDILQTIHEQLQLHGSLRTALMMADKVISLVALRQSIHDISLKSSHLHTTP